MSERRVQKMSMATCAECGNVYDTDFEMSVNKKGECICSDCAEELGLEVCE